MSDDDPLARHLQAVSARFERCLGERAAWLRETAAGLEHGEESAAESLRVAAHRLKGIAGSCGHADLGARAAEIEGFLGDGRSPEAVSAARALAEEADARAAASLAERPVPWVLWVEPDPDLGALSGRQLGRRDDVDATVCTDLEGVRRALASRRAPALLVGPVDHPEGGAITAACARRGTPVVWLGDPDESASPPVLAPPAGPGSIPRVLERALDAVRYAARSA